MRAKSEAHYLDDLFCLGCRRYSRRILESLQENTDRYYRPVLVVTHSQEAGILKGSGRSIDGLDMYEEMKNAPICL